MDVAIEDITYVVRLVREVGDRWDDPRAWREHLLLGACALLQGSAGSMHELQFKENRPDVRTLAVVGLPAVLTTPPQSLTECVPGREVEEVAFNAIPCFGKLYDNFVRLGWATATRDELTGGVAFNRAALYTQFRQPLVGDDYVVSLRKVDVPERAEIMEIDRSYGAAPFGPREVALLKLLHDEISPLVGVRLTSEDHLSRNGLSRRLNETLTLLLQGHSEKEVAAQLALSPRTIHDYVTLLYKHFSVSSRAELLAYFIRRQPLVKTSRAGLENIA